MAKIPSSKLSDKTSKKTGVVMVIAVGGKAPKKPTKTADTKKAGYCGVKKASAVCHGCNKVMNFPDTGKKELCIRCGLVEQFGEDSPEVAEDDERYGD